MRETSQWEGGNVVESIFGVSTRKSRVKGNHQAFSVGIPSLTLFLALCHHSSEVRVMDDQNEKIFPLGDSLVKQFQNKNQKQISLCTKTRLPTRKQEPLCTRPYPRV